MAHRPHRGFTLVELLVVITIIGMLVGILVPAIAAARNRARQTQCMNNQRELGSSIRQYEAKNGRYPGWVEMLGVARAGGIDRRTMANWTVVVMQYLGRGDVWDYWKAGVSENPQAGNVRTYRLDQVPDIAQLKCPTDTAPGRTRPLSYVVNSGLPDSRNVGGGIPSGDRPVDDKTNGVFHNRCDRYILPSYQIEMNSSDIKDGAQYTIMLSENLQAGQWPDPNGIPAAGNTTTPQTNNTYLQNTEACVSLLWLDTLGTGPGIGTGVRINERKDLDFNRPSNANNPSGLAAVTVARPSSNHPGGVVMTFCDGRGLFVKDTMDYIVYQLLMTPDSRNAHPAGTVRYTTVPTNEPYRTLATRTLKDDDFNQ